MKHACFVTVIDSVFCLGMRAINRSEPRFNLYAWPTVRLWAVITRQSLWWKIGGRRIGHEVKCAFFGFQHNLLSVFLVISLFTETHIDRQCIKNRAI